MCKIDSGLVRIAIPPTTSNQFLLQHDSHENFLFTVSITGKKLSERDRD